MGRLWAGEGLWPPLVSLPAQFKTAFPSCLPTEQCQLAHAFSPNKQAASEEKGHQAPTLGFSRNSGISDPPLISVLRSFCGCGVTGVTGVMCV